MAFDSGLYPQGAGTIKGDYDSSGNLVFFQGRRAPASQAIHYGRDAYSRNFDVKFFGATSGAYMLWDESADELLLTNADFRVVLGAATDYIQFDVSNQKLYFFRAPAGENDRTFHLDLEPTGPEMRRGAISIDIWRSEDMATWAGSPDCGIKIQLDCDTDNSDNSGAVRSIDTTARNRGADISWIHGIHAGVRNDSGSNCYELVGFSTRVENYGVMNTQCVGIDVNLSIESDDGAGTKTGILIRNTDQSAQTAADEVFKISHTSTNGFVHLINFAGASGESIESGSLNDSNDGNILSDARIKIVWNSTTYYLAAYAHLADT